MVPRPPVRSAFGRKLAFVCIALGAELTPRSAAPQVRLQVAGDVSGGYSDNIQSTPDVPPPGVPPKTSGEFVLLSPGLVVASASRRANHRLAYTYTYGLYPGQSSANTSSNRLDYRGFLDLSPSAGLVVGLNALQSNQYSAIVLTPPGAGVVNATPPGSNAFASVSADQLLWVDVDPGVRAYEVASVTEQIPIFDTVAPRTFFGTGSMGVDRALRSDSIGTQARAEYSVIDGSLAPDGTPLGTQRQVVGTAVCVWRHDWTADLTSRAEAGALRVQRLDSGRGFWQPAALASLAYTTPLADVSVSYAHRVTTNPLVGQSFLIDDVQLRGVMPLTRSGRVLATAAAGYQNARIIDENAVLAAHVDAILADVGVTWQATDALLLGLRYQHVGQGSDARTPPLPLSFVRNSVMIGATMRFPPERDMPRAFRAPRRVDGRDEVREGAEPGNDAAPSGRGGADR